MDIHSKEIVWKTPEFEHREKDLAWFLYVLGGALILIILAAWQGSWFFGLFILIAAFLVIFLGRQKPNLRECRVSDRGIKLGGRQFIYADFESFSVYDRPGRIDELILKRRTSFNPFVHIPIDAHNVPAVRGILSGRLKEIPHTEGFFDVLVDWFGF